MTAGRLGASRMARSCTTPSYSRTGLNQWPTISTAEECFLVYVSLQQPLHKFLHEFENLCTANSLFICRLLRSFADTARGSSTCMGRPGSDSHETIDANSFAEWGVDYVKVSHTPTIKQKHRDSPFLC